MLSSSNLLPDARPNYCTQHHILHPSRVMIRGFSVLLQQGKDAQALPLLAQPIRQLHQRGVRVGGPKGRQRLQSKPIFLDELVIGHRFRGTGRISGKGQTNERAKGPGFGRSIFHSTSTQKYRVKA